MTRSISIPRPLRVGAAAAGAAGLLALAGCAADTASGTEGSTSPTTSASTSASTGTSASSDYKDGSYTATGSYQNPETVASVDVTVTLKDDIITAVEVTGSAKGGESAQYQSAFIGGIADQVVGKDIDEISVDRVAGSSLTSGGFNAAIEKIKAEARA